MATYSQANFESIAAAIGKDVANVQRYEKDFEAAAMWFRRNREGSKIKRAASSTIEKAMKQIAKAARKLLWHLEVYDHRNAPDGPGDFALLQALGSAEDGSEAEIVQAVAQIGRAIDAAETLERCARKAADDERRMSELTVPKGRPAIVH